MNLSSGVSTEDESAEVMLRLLIQAAQLGRVVLRMLPGDLNQTTASILTELMGGPRRLGELAATEGLAQPTLTAAVIALEARGLVRRHRDTQDRRVVWVEITPAGRRRKRQLHQRAGAILRDGLAHLSDQQAQTVLAAADALELLVDTLQQASTMTTTSRRAAS